MAGVVGFEPTIHGTKNRCLTTWLHPNGERLSTIVDGRVQERFTKKNERRKFFLRSIIWCRSTPLRYGCLPVPSHGRQRILPV